MEEYTKRQEEIISTAIRIIDDKGIQGLTIKNLAREIGITEGAIYRHFQNKQQILVSVLSRFEKDMRDMEQNILNSEESASGKIASILNNLRKTFEKNPAIVSVIFAEEIFKNDSFLEKKITDIIHFNYNFFYKIISEGKQKAEIRQELDETMIVNQIIGSFRLIVKMWKLEEFSISLKEDVNNLLDHLQATVFNFSSDR
ncbi:MAG: TetR/AcrR family transcriptional regulator [Bacteroidales bacterium]